MFYSSLFDRKVIYHFTRENARKPRRYLSRNSHQTFLIALVCVTSCLGIFWVWPRERYSPERSSSLALRWENSRQTAYALIDCLSAPVLSLNSFDPFILGEKSKGLQENDVENRFQEDVWDTILGKYAVYPAWSDMTWNVPQYARGLSDDLATTQALAASLLRLAPPEYSEKSPRYLSPSSPVQINFIHHRLDRLRGLQYMANFNQRKKQNGTTYNVLIEKPLDTSHCQVSIAVSQTAEPAYILLPYKAREQRLRLFFENYLDLRTKYNENLILIVAILRGSSTDRNFVSALKNEVFGSCRKDVMDSVWIHENNGDADGGFSRGVALREAAKLAKNENSVIFQCDVDLILRPGFFERCRSNSILGSQVYYPVFYSLYPYANSDPSIRQRNGFWRTTSFGMVCMRKGDFQLVDPFDDAETRFRGWGSEDVYQFEKVRNASHLVAFRAVEPGILHRWHTKSCDASSAAYEECMRTNFATMGHPIRIGPALLTELNDVQMFFHKLEHLDH